MKILGNTLNLSKKIENPETKIGQPSTSLKSELTGISQKGYEV